MESQDVLIIILLIVFWGIFSLYERLKRKQTPGRKKGFTLRLLELIIALTQDRERETDARKTVPATPEPEDQVNDFEAETTPVVNQTEPDDRVGDEVWTENHVGMGAQPCEHVVRSVDSEVILPVISQKKKRARRKLCRKRMREAVVWAEIIGPPVALQKQE